MTLSTSSVVVIARNHRPSRSFEIPARARFTVARVVARVVSPLSRVHAVEGVFYVALAARRRARRVAAPCARLDARARGSHRAPSFASRGFSVARAVVVPSRDARRVGTRARRGDRARACATTRATRRSRWRTSPSRARAARTRAKSRRISMRAQPSTRRRARATRGTARATRGGERRSGERRACARRCARRRIARGG